MLLLTAVEFTAPAVVTAAVVEAAVLLFLGSFTVWLAATKSFQ